MAGPSACHPISLAPKPSLMASEPSHSLGLVHLEKEHAQKTLREAVAVSLRCKKSETPQVHNESRANSLCRFRDGGSRCSDVWLSERTINEQPSNWHDK